MMNPFSAVGVKNINYNTFDLSHDVKLSHNFGELVPVAWLEALPGDKFFIGTECMTRFMPMVNPVMHRMDVTQHWFYVPYRILWSGWRDFIAPKTDDAVAPAAPFIENREVEIGSLGDYFGLPVDVNIDSFSAFPFAAYQAIYNEYYRDQNLIDEVDYALIDGSNDTNWDAGELSTLRSRAWQHDYFTSCLPSAQKGPDVLLPLGEYAPIVMDSAGPTSSATWTVTVPGVGTPTAGVDYRDIVPSAAGSLYADLSTATAASINDLRTASTLQQYYEAMMRGGSRYIEVLKSMFNVRSSDSRLQRPQYITGNKQPVVISEVLQTSESATTAQGNMAGHGISVGHGGYKDFFCEEHGIIICIQSVMPRSAYQQGLHRMWSRSDRFDFAWPIFANLGEQEVLNRELYYNNDSDDDDTFGYQQRYQEYRSHPSRVAGELRSTLSTWHAGRIFASRPVLNQDFIEMKQAEIDRIFAVTDGSDKLVCHVFNSVKVKRCLPLFAVPQLG